MGIHLREQEFVADMENLVRDFDLWRNAAVPYPPDFVASIAERAYGLFGQTRPADIVAIAVNSGDEDLTEQAVGFLNGSLAMVRDEGVFGWLFHIIWDRELELRGQIERRDTEGMRASFDFLTEASRMAAHILLTWGVEDAACAHVARLFLVEEYDEALNCILPYADIAMNHDEAAALVVDIQRRAFEEELRRDEEERSRADSHVPYSAEAMEATEAQTGEGIGVPSVPPPPPSGADAPGAADGRPFAEANLLYAFDAGHVIDAYRRFLRDGSGNGGSADSNDDGPWNDAGFVQGKLRTLAGAGIIEPLVNAALSARDGEALERALRLLGLYRDVVRDEGLLALPVVAAQTMADDEDLAEDAGFDERMAYVESFRDICSSMAAVLLARVPDSALARPLALSVLDGDAEAYMGRLRSLGMAA